MATIRPFRGYRPPPEFASRVASRPYDVLTSEEARKEVIGQPLSFLRIGKPEVDLDLHVDVHSPEVYAKASENMKRFLDERILVPDLRPSLYMYNLSKETHSQFGIVGCVSVEEYSNGTIRKHELTRPDKEDDRTKHMLATNAHTGPIFLTYRENENISAIMEEREKEQAEYDFVADDGVRHRLWVVDELDSISRLTTLFGGIKHFYVADGHHRAAAAVRAAHDRKSKNPSHTGNEEYNFFLAVLFPDTHVRIMDYNRILRDLNGKTVGQVLNELASSFEVTEVFDEVRPEEKGTFGMYMKGQWYRLVTKSSMIPSDPIEGLDVSLLERFVLRPVFGIEDQRTDPRVDFVGGIRGVRELKQRVDAGIVAAAFSMCPTSMEELLTVADAGNFMPPKSTWFEPKLRDGLVVHLLD